MKRIEQNLSPGDSKSMELVKELSRTQIVQYAGVSGDFNRLHIDEKYAVEAAGYPSVFAHGMLLMGMTARALTEWFGDASISRYGTRFVSQVWPGDSLTANVTVDEIRIVEGQRLVDLTVETVNQDGKTVLKGYATVSSTEVDPCTT